MTLISAFHAQVERTPDASALSWVENGKIKELTYRDLRTHVRRLSNAMSFLNADDTVGIALHRSPACIVAILAVLDAGACYVPLDPSYPKERLAIFVEDAKMSVLLAQKSTICDLPAEALRTSNVQIFLLEESSSKDILFTRSPSTTKSPKNVTTTTTSHSTKHKDQDENDDDHLAYVIFTSGSTGRPKGVAMRRGALRNLIEWQIQELDIPPRGRPARTLQFAPISFDVHFQEIFGTLCAGGVVCLIDDDMRRDAIALLRHIESEKIERIFVPFVALQNLCEAATVVGFEAARSLRDVVTAGEQLKCSRQLRKFFQNANQGKCRLHNHYGPSETHVVTAYTLRGDPKEWPDLPPIGAPIANCECYILDSKGQSVKEGEVGELFLGGVCLARGYLGREKITRERFIKDPFAKSESARMYKTGDLAKVIPETNGVLEFLGRIDSQVKIRGHRVELGEVESAINRHQGVGTQCSSTIKTTNIKTTLELQRSNAGTEAVVVRTTGLGIKQLIAYVIPADVEENKDEELRCLKRTETKLRREDIESHCKTTLPVYMRPARIYLLNRFPLTPSGKVAKRDLPSPSDLDRDEEISAEENGKESKKDEVPLSTSTEKQLAEIWTQVLGLRVRSSEASFVELGGQSLALVQLITRIFVKFKVQISFSQVSQAKSLRDMANMIDSANRSEHVTELEIPSSSEKLPLSYNQQSLFHMSRVGKSEEEEDGAHNNSSLNIPLVARLVGNDVDIDSLRAALEILVRRHEALRTVYLEEEDETPYSKCVQDEKQPFNVLELDATGWSDTKLRDWMIETAETPFDLTQGPVIRIYLVWRDMSRPDEDDEKIEQYLHLTVHHIAVDLWSLVVMMDELAILYKAAKGKSRFKRKKSMLAALPNSPRYVKYAVSQDRLVKSSRFQEQTEKYWRQIFGDSVPVLSIPTDFPRPPRRSFEGSAYSFRIPNDITLKLEQYCRSNRCTMFTVLMSAYQILLARQSGQDDLVVGTPFACRHGMPGISGSELEQTVGYFVNALPVRGDLTGMPTFGEIVRRTRNQLNSTLEHQQMPLPRLVELLNPPRDPSRAPLFDAMFVLQRSQLKSKGDLSPFFMGVQDAPLVLSEGLEMRSIALPLKHAQFDLTLQVAGQSPEDGNGLHADLRYCTALFTRERIELMSQHFVSILRNAVTTNRKQTIWEMPLLSEIERSQLLSWGQGREMKIPQDCCVHEMVDEAALRNPSAVAIEADAKKMTYAALRSDSNVLARYLQFLGIDPNGKEEQIVAVVLKRSPRLVVAQLAVMKAGAASIPVDHKYPADRMEFMLSDAKCHVVITETSCMSHLPKKMPHDAVVVNLDEEWDLIRRGRDDPLPTLPSERARRRAAIIYTSGSTGRPKGVVMEHRNILAITSWHNEFYKIRPGERTLHNAGLAFDACQQETWPTLIAGATIVMLTNREVQLTPHLLLDWLSKQRVTFAFLTTQLAEAVLEQGRIDDRLSLRVLVTGGDKLHRGPTAGVSYKLYNGYGPCENTICTTQFCVPPDDFEKTRRKVSSAPLIGRPNPNVRVYVLDKYLKLAPLGTCGELCVSGPQVTRGYLRRAKKNAERFLTNPFYRDGTDKELWYKRMYRTGDLVRWTLSGDLEFVGRADNQVKIRGFRVELGGIETVLLEHDVVKETVVIARSGRSISRSGGNDKQLVAYYTSDVKQQPSPLKLREFCSKKLADYMLPAAFVCMKDGFPITANGKVNRKRLPAPSASDFVTSAFVAPQSENEKIVASLMADVLGRDESKDPVGLRNDFFAIGGHSLLASRLSSAIKKRFRVKKFSLAMLFDNPTVEDIAKILSEKKTTKTKSPSLKKFNSIEVSSFSPRSEIPPDASSISLKRMVTTGSITSQNKRHMNTLMRERSAMSPSSMSVSKSQKGAMLMFEHSKKSKGDISSSFKVASSLMASMSSSIRRLRRRRKSSSTTMKSFTPGSFTSGGLSLKDSYVERKSSGSGTGRSPDNLTDLSKSPVPSLALSRSQSQSGLHFRNKKKNVRCILRACPHIVPFTHTSNTEQVHVVSFNQQSLWFLQRLDPNRVDYVCHFCVRIRDEKNDRVDVSSLEFALRSIVRRHPALRTTYENQGGMPLQIIHDMSSEIGKMSSKLIRVTTSKDWDSDRLSRELHDRVHESFDLTKGPILRSWIFQDCVCEGEEKRSDIFLLTAHHIAMDGWSMEVILQELGQLYAQSRAVKSNVKDFSELSKPSNFHMGDFSRQQKQRVENDSEDWDFWKSNLVGPLPVLNLPTDFERPVTQSSKGSVYTWSLPLQLCKQLRDLAADQRCTLFVLLLSAWNTMLMRYTGQSDVVVGTPMAARDDPRFESLIGQITNPVVLRSDLSGDPSFRALLRRVRNIVVEAFDHQDFPFALLVERLVDFRDTSRSPLFQVLFSMNQPFNNKDPENSFAALEMGCEIKLGKNIRMSSQHVPQDVSPYDIQLVVTECADNLPLKMQLQYCTALFREETVKRMASHLTRILEFVSESPDCPLSQIEMLTQNEIAQQLVRFNATSSPFDRKACIHELFERRVEENRRAAAIVVGTSTLSYGEVNRRANQLARYLRRMGVGRDKIVGLFMTRGAELIISMLAIAKAGGAYVPVDPAYPPERVEYMAADSGMVVLLTLSQLIDKVPTRFRRSSLFSKSNRSSIISTSDTDEEGGVPFVEIDRVWNEICRDSDDTNLNIKCDPSQLVYLIYTSGSTGKPKGVMIEHRGLVARAAWHRGEYGITSQDRASQLIAPAFDPVGLEVWPFLTSGASIHIAPEEARVDPGCLRRWLKAHRITVSLMPTPVAEVFVHTGARQFEQGKKSWPRTLRVLYTGGDKLKAPPRTPLPFRFDNHYGPSECTIIATFCQVRQPTSKDEKSVPPPIGGPCANVKLYVLDPQRRLVPIGASGELWIGGHGLARGYLNREQLSSERFVPLPSQLRSSLDRPDARMYRTGDLVRYIPGSNGELDFLGRVDQQVKIRGMRIELGEIESTLASAEWVRECSVIAREDRPGEKRLVAYVVTQSGVLSQKREIESSNGQIQPLKMTEERRELVLELRSVLKQRLAEYMVPHTNCWVFLRALPLTPNGKVNKRALPPPLKAASAVVDGETRKSVKSSVFVAPRTEDEEIVGTMLCGILSLPAVSVHDNFFELGGHSLAATQLLAAVQETFGVDLPIGTLFANPTVAAIVRQIHALRGDVLSEESEEKEEEKETNKDESKDLEDLVDRDLRLLDGISFDASSMRQNKKQSVAILTGATGFVGAYVLHQLLIQPEESTRKLSKTIVVCIVRGGSDREARQRVQKNLVKYDLWRDLLSVPRTKLRVLAGDLALPKFGLQDEIYDNLRRNVTEIYHCAAWVHGLYPYERLRRANVVGTAEILKLSSQASPSAPVHYISTLSVVPESYGNVSERDELPRDSFSKLHQGYAQTKWVAEKLVHDAANRGLRTTVWRLGRITGHNITGVASTEDFMCRFIKGCVQLGCAPELRWPVDMNPVNLVGAAIVRISRRGNFGKTFHYCHPNPPPLPALFKWLDRFGYPIQIVKYMQWRENLMNCKSDNSLMPLRTYFEADENWGQSGAPKFDSSNLTSELGASDLWGAQNVDAKLLGTYFKYYIKIGFMPERRSGSPLTIKDDDTKIRAPERTMPQKIGSVTVKRQWSAESTLSSQSSGDLPDRNNNTTGDALFDMEFE